MDYETATDIVDKIVEDIRSRVGIGDAYDLLPIKEVMEMRGVWHTLVMGGKPPKRQPKLADYAADGFEWPDHGLAVMAPVGDGPWLLVSYRHIINGVAHGHIATGPREVDSLPIEIDVTTGFNEAITSATTVFLPASSSMVVMAAEAFRGANYPEILAAARTDLIMHGKVAP